jgi:hypothetical protein
MKDIKTTKDVIDYVLDYFSTHARSLDHEEGMCMYNGVNSGHCAFAICCTDPEVDLKQYECQASSDVFKFTSLSILKPEFRRLRTSASGKFLSYEDLTRAHTGFWDSIQSLHDSPGHWNPKPGSNGNVLTKVGEDYVSKLRRDW